MSITKTPPRPPKIPSPAEDLEQRRKAAQPTRVTRADAHPEGAVQGSAGSEASQAAADVGVGVDATARAANDDPDDPVETYLKLGWHPIILHGVDAEGHCSCGKYPCGTDNRSAGKHPREHGWQRSGPAQYYPEGANVGLRMGAQPSGARLLALDDDGGLAALEATLGALPETLTSRTPSGGAHRVFTVPEGPKFANAVRVAGHAVDVRCDGGQIVVAPSRVPRGEYAWTVFVHPVPLPDAWLRALSGEATIDLDALDDPRLLAERAPLCPAGTDPVEVAREWLTRAPKAIEGQGGHGSLFDRACELIAGYGLDRETADALLREYNETRCIPPFDPESSEWQHKLNEAEQCQREPGYLLEPAEETPVASAEPAVINDWNFLPDDYDPTSEPPVEYVCEDLDIVRNELTVLVGHGGGGKTTLAMTLGLCVAFGLPVFGDMPVRQGRVVHISYEMSRPMLVEKYLRLAKALGITENPFRRHRVHLAIHPRVRYGHKEFAAKLGAAIQGAELCLIDSLRPLTAGLDENSSATGDAVYKLQEIANLAECAIALLHHSGKSGDPRGFSGIRDACRTMLMIKREEGSTISNLSGAKVSTRELSSVNTAFQFIDKPDGGLAVARCAPRAEAYELKERVRLAFIGQPDRTFKSKTALAQKLGGRKADALAAINALIAGQEIVEHKSGEVSYVGPRNGFSGFGGLS